jgi:hypothetical protein
VVFAKKYWLRDWTNFPSQQALTSMIYGGEKNTMVKEKLEKIIIFAEK